MNLTPIRGTTPIHSNHLTFATPKFYSVPHNRVVEEGANVSVQAVVAGEPSPWTTWDKDGIILTTTSRVFIKEKNDIRTLEIENVTMNDSGLYRITIENDYGRSESTFRLDVISTRHGKHNEIDVKNNLTTSSRGFRYTRRIISTPVHTGSRLIFKSMYNSRSEPSAKFYHNGNLLKESERISFRIEKKCITLEIKNPRIDDIGEYLLKAGVDNEVYCTSTVVTQDFLKPEGLQKYLSSPEITKPLPKTLEIIEGTTTDLTFEIHSTTPYEYKWYKDNIPIPDTDDFQYIDQQNGLLTLRIKDPFIQDTACYSCCVCNSNGTVTTSILLEILEAKDCPPTFVQSPKSMVSHFGDVVSFYAMVLPTNATTKWFVRGKEIVESSNEFMVCIEKFEKRISGPLKKKFGS